MRTGFSGLRGVAGSWEVLLAIGGLYLQYDSLARNQEKAEAEIGSKAHEAKLALQGSQLGLLGGQIELVGLVLRSSAGHMDLSGARGAPGVSLIKLGAMLSAVAGVFDTAQAFAASKRASAQGDDKAGTLYSSAGIVYGFSTGLFAYAALKMFLLGPLGLAIALALTAYALSKWAGSNESSALERWARRCCFGKGNEKPAVHWPVPEYADIAFAELNAATLGVHVGVNFESKRLNDPAASKIGGMVSLELEHKLRFEIILPVFSDERSAFRWTLVAHRHGDGNFPDFIGGETLLVDEYQAFPVDALNKTEIFPDFSKPKTPDYRTDFSVNKKRQSSASEHSDMSWLEITGDVGLMATIGSHTIRAATLLVMYWPDRTLPEAYVEICVKEVNE